MSEEGQSNKEININEWLKQTKLGDYAADIIKKRNVSMDELIEFEEDDLKEFATKDLGLDTLAKNRLIRSIRKLKHANLPNQKYMTMPFIPKKQTVIVSSSENEAMIKLLDQYNKTSLTMNQIQKAVYILNDFELNDINNIINSLINNLKNKKETLLQSIDTIFNDKTNILNKQKSEMEHYLQTVSEARLKYEKYTNDKTIIHKKRKRLILDMVENVLNQSTMALLTTPKIQFNIELYMNKLTDIYDTMKLNDCDHPGIMSLILKKVKHGAIYVQYNLNKLDIVCPKKILEIVLEYAILPKEYTKSIPRTQKQKKIKNKKRKSSIDSEHNSSDNSSDSEDEKSMNSYDSDSDSYEEDNEYEINIDNVNMSELKWIKNVKKIKYRKNNKDKNKYKIDEVKAWRGYLIRIRARNSSGWSTYSNIVVAFVKESMEILKFSDTFRSSNGLELLDKRRCVKRISQGHKYILADTKPVSKGKHCWRVHITNNKHWLFLGVAQAK
eukprot:252557_1